jgi:hypothetical protein
MTMDFAERVYRGKGAYPEEKAIFRNYSYSTTTWR